MRSSETPPIYRGRPFVIYTDHRALQFWTTTSASAKVERWRQLLSVYDCIFRFLEGEKNISADLLSRAMLSMIQPDGDSGVQHRLAPPINLALVHGEAAGHFHVEKTLQKLKLYKIQWPDMEKDVAEYIKRCPQCQKTSQARSGSHAAPFRLDASRPWDKLGIDTMGELKMDEKGYTHILVVIDYMSSFVRLYPMRAVSGEEVAEKLLQLFCQEGVPRAIHSDNGTEFINQGIQTLTSWFKTPHSFSIPYSHQENGKAERVIKDVRRQLTMLIHEIEALTKRWAAALPLVERIINTKMNTKYGATPAQIRYGHFNALETGIFMEDNATTKKTPWMQELQEIQKKIMQSKEATPNRNEENQGTIFKIGDIILVERVIKIKANLDYRRDGPFLVMGQEGAKVLYEDYTTGKVRAAHVSRCRHYLCRGDPIHELRLAKAKWGRYDVEKVISHDLNKSTLLIKWHCYDVPELEKISNKELINTEVVQQYLRSVPELSHLVNSN